MNVVCLNGRLASDPEGGESSGGVAYATFPVAIEKGYGDNKSVIYLDCCTFRQQADFVLKHLHKADAVNVTGAINVRDWTDQAGVKHRKYEIVATQINFPVSGKARGAGGTGRGQDAPRNGQRPVAAAAGVGAGDPGPQPWDNDY